MNFSFVFFSRKKLFTLKFFLRFDFLFFKFNSFRLLISNSTIEQQKGKDQEKRDRLLV